MKTSAALLLVVSLLGAKVQPYRLALPGYHYEFPRDHFNHPEFQTEWWYYTGNLRAADGKRFGFELTFFRQGVDRSKTAPAMWDVRDIWLAHFALSDIDGGQFLHTERLNRAGPGLAGADQNQARVWNGNWQSRWSANSQEQTLAAVADNFEVKLTLRSEKPPAVNGVNGVSQKAEGPGRASHYISLTRLVARGTLTVVGASFPVEGLAWMDHEFFTHQLSADQTGWDWFSLQFDDRSELMLFRLRRKDGTADKYSAGTYIDPSGRTRTLTSQDFALTSGRIWKSPATGARYPVEWTVRVPSLGVHTLVTTRLPQQELTGKRSGVTAYWEGAIELRGTKNGQPFNGAGYLEMTGYAAPVHLSE